MIHLDTVHLKASLFVKRKIGVIPALPVILHQHLNLIGGNNRRIRHRFVDEGGKAGFQAIGDFPYGIDRRIGFPPFDLAQHGFADPG
ncbi:hypothetical protein D3C81_1970080 [compost metagenome]